MDSFRLFISLPVEAGVASKLLKEFKRLDLPWEKLKTVEAKDLHLTLKFLGDTALEKLPDIINALENIDLNINNLDLKISKAKIFNPQRPQVIVLGLAENLELMALYQAIEDELFSAGIAHKEMKRFSPHITLARVKQAATIEEFKTINDWQIEKEFSVNHFDLQESVLSSHGPEYNILQSFNL
jgi:2'-5' RNA ligase